MTVIKNATPSNDLSLEQLCVLVDLPRRTVRYYIQLGLVDRPEGETRAARYTQAHVEQLLNVKKWTLAGLSLDRIREMKDAGPEPALPLPTRRPGSVEVWTHLLVDEGVELKIEPKRAGLSPEQVRHLMRRVLDALQQIKKEQTE
ncbi:MAG: MerR family transcriptional regulator [Panacagrimonas sp.]|jgi:DNA-binding transcriptional MerR regulator|nr:MerR family transcriptional regulator [Panacagrimonas sp.]MCC2655748.1 MerR family transcriptional regulator [Panacagrimonas sp.]